MILVNSIRPRLLRVPSRFFFFFFGGGGGGQVLAAYNVRTINVLEMKFGRVVEDHTLIFKFGVSHYYVIKIL